MSTRPHSSRRVRTATSHALHRFAVTALALVGLGLTVSAHAENHALILWIGNYAQPSANLPGIDKDAAMARQLARAMGVPDKNIRELSNAALAKTSMGNELRNLTTRIAKDDKVFIYYSGHGAQVKGLGGAKCTEGMVTHEIDIYTDVQLQQVLTDLGNKASQVVMFNDSCFSGGAATKASRDLTGPSDAPVPKFYSGPLPQGTGVNDDYTCGEQVNKMSRNLEVVAAAPRAPQVLYVAASAANEVSFATTKGSAGTLAWLSCIGSADSNRSGAVDAEELRACAQQWLDRGKFDQHITLAGNTKLPLTFVSNTPAGSGNAPVNAARALEDLRATADPAHAVTLSPVRGTLKIGQDPLDFSITTTQPGYLYVLHVGSDGKTFDLLFPNKQDSNNYVAAGNHSFPRPSWRIKASGPAGTSYLMAVVSPVQRNFNKDMDLGSVFPQSNATTDSAKNLVIETTGAAGAGARFGASAVVAIRESN
ncbi:DUF4384 domain-containing protein [Sphaerotilus mobilis]|uniref:Caspase domain-containing protein n=1 Tax=Sphaerotilus mobilis TaxID=47994 RepID=A0A4Q7LQH8_9BURK|nr:DUF4384 domain-containing protein [Sphaerotilus mobilis]RZS57116.1 caspase domain-containing protein [Sphaerotilus mobilis]